MLISLLVINLCEQAVTALKELPFFFLFIPSGNLGWRFPEKRRREMLCLVELAIKIFRVFNLVSILIALLCHPANRRAAATPALPNSLAPIW